MHIVKAAIVGAGAMGTGIAQVISDAGLPVIVKDVNQALVDKGLNTIRSIYQSRVDRGRMSAGQMQRKISLVSGTATYQGFEDVDIVIEALPEQMSSKRQVLAELESVCPDHAIFASSTEILSISEMAAATQRPGKVLGMHFLKPAYLTKLVEIIPGRSTRQETIDDAAVFTEALGKTAVLVQERPGFLVNRLMIPYLNEAVIALGEGAATAAEIDSAMTAFGWAMGPFTLMDMLGVDACYQVAAYLHSEYGDRMAPGPLFGLLFRAGRHGEKTGAGFYGYGGQTNEPVREMIAQLQAAGKARRSSEFSVDRLMLPMINEAALCVTEAVASIDDIDTACTVGVGMKVGDEPLGPLQLADEMGLDFVLAKLEALQAELGERFRPASLLRTHVRAGHLGRKTGRGFREYTA